MTTLSPAFFMERFAECSSHRPIIAPDEYHRDRERIVRSAAFFRLRGKTQMLAASNGNGCRTRFTHTLECAEIGSQLLDLLIKRRASLPVTVRKWLPDRALLEATCFAHDLGHPPFGHRGEEALYQMMRDAGGFEGNGQTLRIVAQRGPSSHNGEPILPTRRLVLAVLKYPAAYSTFDTSKYGRKPPKCYFDDEQQIVDWALGGFSDDDATRLTSRDHGDRTQYRSLDCSLMDLADDIANGVYDIDEIIACGVAEDTEIEHAIKLAFDEVGGCIPSGDGELSASDTADGLFGGDTARRKMVAKLARAFVMSVRIETQDGFAHPLLAYRASLDDTLWRFLIKLRTLTHRLLVNETRVLQWEWRGQTAVQGVFEALSGDPDRIFAQRSKDEGMPEAPTKRQICDFVADMTDLHVEQLAQRLFCRR